jgi:hypothetical protein
MTDKPDPVGLKKEISGHPTDHSRKALWRKKPVVIQAVEWNGRNRHELIVWLGIPPEVVCASNPLGQTLVIKTLEGEMTASVGDYIIRGVKGEFYPCKPDIFAATYEPAEPAPSLPEEGGQRLSAREWMAQTGEHATELMANVGKETYDQILADMDEFAEQFREAGASTPGEQK